MISLRFLPLIVLTSMSCSDDSATHRTLKAAGFSEIRTTGYAPFQCGKDDDFATGFSAVNPAGVRVEGTVCCGLWQKACTVRF